MTDLKEKLKVQIIELSNLEGMEPKDINSSEPLFGEGLGLDSIDALDLIVLLEKEYGIKITDPNVGKKVFSSIDSIAQFITENQK